MSLNAKAKQDALQVVFDKLAGVQFPEGQEFMEVVSREVDRAAVWVENRIKTSLSVVRKTDLPGSGQECYEDKDRFRSQINPLFLSFPRWAQLTDAQRAIYANTSTLYKDGALPWDLLTEEQMYLWNTQVSYASNKAENAEKQDGKNTAYIKLYRGPLVKFHSLALSFVNVPGYQNLATFFRLYQPNEILVYEKEGAIHIFPAVMARLLSSTQDPMYGSQFGVVSPRIPQVLHIDYEYGYKQVPLDLLEAVATKAALEIIGYITSIMTAGLRGFGVQGFNANFGDGILYPHLITRLEKNLEKLLVPYYRLNMTGW
jgi:hypothetical protein